MNRFLGAFTATVAIAVTLAACGGSSDSGLSKTDLIAKGDAICKSGQEVLNQKATAEFQSSPTPASMTKFIKAVAVPAYEDQLSKMRALEPDSESKESWDAMLNELDQGIGKIKTDPASALKADASPLADASQAARDFGMKVCGSND